MEEVQDPTTYWPLGQLCEHGGTEIAHQSWPATIVSYSSSLSLLVSIVVLALIGT